MKTLAVIPARFASTRLPGKPLLPVRGVPLVVRVLRRVERCSSVDRIIVAADDERVAEAVHRAGGECLLTPPELPSGGDRVAWVAERIPSDLVLNVQVDDPLVGPDMIDPLAAAMGDPAVMLALLSKRIDREEEVFSPNIVKMVFDAGGRALYFSRSPFPARETETPSITSISAPIAGGGISCSNFPPGNRRPSRERKAWKCSGSSKEDIP